MKENERINDVRSTLVALTCPPQQKNELFIEICPIRKQNSDSGHPNSREHSRGGVLRLRRGRYLQIGEIGYDSHHIFLFLKICTVSKSNDFLAESFFTMRSTRMHFVSSFHIFWKNIDNFKVEKWTFHYLDFEVCPYRL